MIKHALILAAAWMSLVTPLTAPAQMNAAPAAAPSALAPGVVPRDALARLVPPAVFFAGQVASTQTRNAGAVRLPDGHFIVATLVDTSGYSSSIQEKYQAYLIAEAALSIDGHTLPAGAYGCGFIANDTFIVMDIGGGTLFTAHSTRDAEMRRPTPLQMLAAPAGDGYRLYAGRSYITLREAKQ
jgi:hypothetical protein